MALASPLSRDCKVLDAGKSTSTHLESVHEAGGSVKIAKANPAEAAKLVSVLDGSKKVVDTLCPTDYSYYKSMFKEVLGESAAGQPKKAAAGSRRKPKTMAAGAGR